MYGVLVWVDDLMVGENDDVGGYKLMVDDTDGGYMY